MVTALDLYCDLLAEPGVLSAPFERYGSELRLVAAASRRLVEKMVTLDSGDVSRLADLDGFAHENRMFPAQPVIERKTTSAQRWDSLPPVPIDNLAAELLANRNLLAALAGPAICVTVETEGREKPVRLSGEDLTRMLVNLVRNATEAMSGSGTIHIRLSKSPSPPTGTGSLALSIDDSGPGIPANALEKIFTAGFTTHIPSTPDAHGSATHRGLGLSIVQSIVEAAGGIVRAENRVPSGARFVLEFPLRNR
jgi:signal transduction histidine kinase